MCDSTSIEVMCEMHPLKAAVVLGPWDSLGCTNQVKWQPLMIISTQIVVPEADICALVWHFNFITPHFAYHCSLSWIHNLSFV